MNIGQQTDRERFLRTLGGTRHQGQRTHEGKLTAVHELPES